MDTNILMLMADTQNISFSNSEIVNTVLSGVLMAIVPVIAFFIMRKYMKFDVKSVVIGAVVWFVFAIVLKSVILLPVLALDNSVSRAVKGNVWLYSFVAALAAGLFEETGRFAAFKTVLKKNDDKQDSLSYGFGHGGFEALYLGLQIASIGLMMFMINKNGINAVAKGATPEMTKQILASIEQYCSKDIGHALLFGFERIPAMITHITFSVMVFAAVKERKMWLYPMAMFLHFAIDYMLVLYYAEVISLLLAEIIFAVLTVALFVAVIKLVYNKTDYKKELANWHSGNI